MAILILVAINLPSELFHWVLKAYLIIYFETRDTQKYPCSQRIYLNVLKLLKYLTKYGKSELFLHILNICYSRYILKEKTEGGHTFAVTNSSNVRLMCNFNKAMPWQEKRWGNNLWEILCNGKRDKSPHVFSGQGEDSWLSYSKPSHFSIISLYCRKTDNITLSLKKFFTFTQFFKQLSWYTHQSIVLSTNSKFNNYTKNISKDFHSFKAILSSDNNGHS